MDSNRDAQIMTNRIKGLVVVLDRDIREDDIDGIKSAIAHVKYVERVDDVPTDPGDFIVRSRLISEIAAKVGDLAQEIWRMD